MTSTDGEGLRERKKRRTRDALRLAALRLADERGLDGVTVDAIAAAADVSARTFFNYFASKDDALVGIDAGLADAIIATLADRPAEESPLRALRETFLLHLPDSETERETWRLRVRLKPVFSHAMLTTAAGTLMAWDARLAASVAQRLGLETGDAVSGDPRDAYARLVAIAASAARRLALHEWADRGCVGTAEPMLRRHFAVLESGFDPGAGA